MLDHGLFCRIVPIIHLLLDLRPYLGSDKLLAEVQPEVDGGGHPSSRDHVAVFYDTVAGDLSCNISQLSPVLAQYFLCAIYVVNKNS